MLLAKKINHCCKLGHLKLEPGRLGQSNFQPCHPCKKGDARGLLASLTLKDISKKTNKLFTGCPALRTFCNLPISWGLTDPLTGLVHPEGRPGFGQKETSGRNAMGLKQGRLTRKPLRYCRRKETSRRKTMFFHGFPVAVPMENLIRQILGNKPLIRNIFAAMWQQ